MFNVMLDKLPYEWHGYPIDASFRTGIQIMQCLQDEEYEENERVDQAIQMIFYGDKVPSTLEEAMQGLEWYLNEYNHDNHKKEKSKVLAFDFDVDQWRIYAAFMKQYGIDLNTVQMHWFVFMGLLTNLEECSFTRVVDIRCKKLDAKMQQKERKAIMEAQKIYSLGAKTELTEEEKQKNDEALAVFNQLRNKK